jgi:hypothetical protein
VLSNCLQQAGGLYIDIQVAPLYNSSDSRELLLKIHQKPQSQGANIMTKGLDMKKSPKKEPTKTLKEKRAAKKLKKEEKKHFTPS